MFTLIIPFLLGAVSGLRALTGLAVVSWAARLGYLHLDHTWLAFLGFAFTPYIFTLLAIGEIINDKLPKTPSRLIPPQFATRVITGTLCGIALGLSNGHVLIGALAGAIGAVAGTLGGAHARAFVAKLFGRDLPAALLEDASAIGIAIAAIALIP